MLFLTSSHALLSHELGSVVGRDKKKLTSYIQLPVIPARYLHFFSDVLEGEFGQRIPHVIVLVFRGVSSTTVVSWGFHSRSISWCLVLGFKMDMKLLKHDYPVSIIVCDRDSSFMHSRDPGRHIKFRS